MSATQPRLIDLFCCQGGAAMGYSRAGFEVVGVDKTPQPRYPFAFVQMDALEALSVLLTGGYITDDKVRRWYLPDFDAIHASPPCQKYQKLNTKNHATHPDLIMPTRNLLLMARKLFVIENVPDARHLLLDPVMLCGSMFGLNIERHRYFEIWPTLPFLSPPCQHKPEPVLLSGVSRRKGQPRIESTADECRIAADLGWMTRAGIDQAIPPAYTEFIGRHLLQALFSPTGAAL